VYSNKVLPNFLTIRIIITGQEKDRACRQYTHIEHAKQFNILHRQAIPKTFAVHLKLAKRNSAATNRSKNIIFLFFERVPANGNTSEWWS
jgi:hypothetical protein